MRNYELNSPQAGYLVLIEAGTDSRLVALPALAGPAKAQTLIETGLLSDLDSQIVSQRFGFEDSEPRTFDAIGRALAAPKSKIYRRYQIIEPLLEATGADYWPRLGSYLADQLLNSRRDLPGVLRRRGQDLVQSQLLSETDCRILDLYLGLETGVRLPQAAIGARLNCGSDLVNDRFLTIRDLLALDPATDRFRVKAADYLKINLNRGSDWLPVLVKFRLEALTASQLLLEVDSQIMTGRLGLDGSSDHSFRAVANRVGHSDKFVGRRWGLIEPLLLYRSDSPEYQQALTEYQNKPARVASVWESNTGAGQLLELGFLNPEDQQILSLKSQPQAGSHRSGGQISQLINRSGSYVYSRLEVLADLMGHLEADPVAADQLIADYLNSNFRDYRWPLSPWWEAWARRLDATGLLSPVDHLIMTRFLGLEEQDRWSKKRICQLLDCHRYYVQSRLEVLKSLIETEPDSPAGRQAATDYLDCQLSDHRLDVSIMIKNQARNLIDSQLLSETDNQIIRLYLGLDQPKRLAVCGVSRQLRRSQGHTSQRWLELKEFLKLDLSDPAQRALITSYQAKNQIKPFIEFEPQETDRLRQLLTSGILIPIDQKLARLILATIDSGQTLRQFELLTGLDCSRTSLVKHCQDLKSLVEFEPADLLHQSALVDYLRPKIRNFNSQLPPIILDRVRAVIDSGCLSGSDVDIIKAITGLDNGRRLSESELSESLNRPKSALSERCRLIKPLLSHPLDSDGYRQALASYRVNSLPAGQASRPRKKSKKRPAPTATVDRLLSLTPARPNKPPSPVHKKRAQTLISRGQLDFYLDEAIVIGRYGLDSQGQVSLMAISRQLGRSLTEITARYRLIKQLVELDLPESRYQACLASLNKPKTGLN